MRFSTSYNFIFFHVGGKRAKSLKKNREKKVDFHSFCLEKWSRETKFLLTSKK